MKDLSQVLLGILAALVSVGIILGSFALSIAESGFPVALIQEDQLTSTSYPTTITIVDTPAPGEPTFTPSPTISIAHRQTSVATTTLLQPVNCPLPEGWISIIIEPGDTLERLANAYDTTPDDLALNNCLVIDTLIPGTVLWVPKVDRAGKVKPPAEKCGPPSTWVFYIVKPGDTLYGLSLTTGTSVSQLQWANCLGSSTVIRVGQSLYLPFIPKPTPTRKPVILPTFTSTPTRKPPPANNPPTANPQSVNSSEDTPIEIILTGSDPDGDTLTFYVVNDPMHGVLFGIPPLLTYAPDTGFTGADSFFFVANDGWVDSPPAKVSITITPDNEAPVANPQSVVTEQDTPVGITLTGSDPDGDTLTFSIVADPNHGNLSGTPPNLTYTPDSNYSGSDSFTFKVDDGQVGSSPAMVDITITKVNNPPVAHPQSVNTTEGTPIGITLTGSDPDGDSLTYSIVSNPTNGLVTGIPPNLTYLSDPGYTGTDSLTFKLFDGELYSAPAVVSITITAESTSFQFLRKFTSLTLKFPISLILLAEESGIYIAMNENELKLPQQ